MRHFRNPVQEKVAAYFRSEEKFKTRKGIVHPDFDPVMVDFISRHASAEDRILEVGGGSGYFLDMVLQNVELSGAYNLGIAYEAYTEQANDSISLIGGDILRAPFEDSSFRFVVIKNVLRHLVGKSPTQSKIFAQQAIREVVRITQNESYLLLFEQYINKSTMASIAFYITLMFFLLRIRFKSLGIYKGYVVSFLTPDEIEDMLCGHNMEIVLRKQQRLKVSLIHRLTLLMSNTGQLLLVGKIRK